MGWCMDATSAVQTVGFVDWKLLSTHFCHIDLTPVATIFNWSSTASCRLDLICCTGDSSSLFITVNMQASSCNCPPVFTLFWGERIDGRAGVVHPCLSSCSSHHASLWSVCYSHRDFPIQNWLFLPPLSLHQLLIIPWVKHCFPGKIHWGFSFSRLLIQVWILSALAIHMATAVLRSWLLVYLWVAQYCHFSASRHWPVFVYFISQRPRTLYILCVA